MEKFTSDNQDIYISEKEAEFEQLLAESTRWRYRGIKAKFLDADSGLTFLQDITNDKRHQISLTEVQQVALKLKAENKTLSKPAIDALSEESGFKLCEAFYWEKVYLP